MKFSIFVDTNVFIYSFEYPQSNSAKIIDLINKDEIVAVVSVQVIKEVTRYFEKYHSISLARLFRRYLLESCIVVAKNDVFDMMFRYKNQINEKDLEQLAVVKKFRIKYLVSYDRDFQNFEEYITPKEFVKLMKLKFTNTEF